MDLRIEWVPMQVAASISNAGIQDFHWLRRSGVKKNH